MKVELAGKLRSSEGKGFSGTIAMGIATIVFGTIVLSGAALFSAAKQSDELSVERQALATRHAIEMSIDELALQQETVAVWDDSAARLVSIQPDLQWVHDNIGLWLHGIFDHDESFILNGYDQLVYAAGEGKVASESLYRAQERDLQPLLKELRRSDPKSVGLHDRRKGQKLAANSTVRTTSRATHETRMAVIAGRPAAVSAMLIQPSTPNYVAPRGKWPILISVRFLDEEFLDQLSKHQLVRSPRFSHQSRHAENEYAIALKDESGRAIGYLIWEPDLPGTAVVRNILAPNLFVLALLISFILLLGRRLWKAVAKLAATEQQAMHLAMHDPLTGLPNRAYFNQRLDRVANSSECFGLALVDVDEFKLINDTLGHDAGDLLLIILRDRLEKAVRSSDFIVRLGGDEFAVVFELADLSELDQCCERLVDHVNGPWEYQGKLLECRVTIGASGAKADSCGQEVLKQADLALYQCKSSARGSYRIYEPSMWASAIDRQRMLTTGSEALANDLIRPFYQPKIDLRSGDLVGFEALLRLCMPGGDVRGPEHIDAAFESGALAVEISTRMIELVLDDIGEWRRAGVPFGHVAINAGTPEVRSRAFGTRLIEMLKQKKVPSDCIQVEVTEGVLLGRGADHVERTFKLLADAGVKLALDDFGTGFASLTHLKQFPIDIIKIDRRFVRDLQTDPEDEAIVQAILGLASALQIQVVAEGVELPFQRDFLAALGCQYGQGYLFGRAVPGSEVPGLLSDCLARRAA